MDTVRKIGEVGMTGGLQTDEDGRQQALLFVRAADADMFVDLNSVFLLRDAPLLRLDRDRLPMMEAAGDCEIGDNGVRVLIPETHRDRTMDMQTTWGRTASSWSSAALADGHVWAVLVSEGSYRRADSGGFDPVADMTEIPPAPVLKLRALPER